MKRVLPILFCLVWGFTSAQNVAISDDENHTADESAVLDVKSTTKGMLVPRVTTTQREAINNPATGLLVFDVNLAAFFFYNGGAWLDLSSSESEYWNTDGSGLNMIDPALNVGIGTSAGEAKLEIQGDGSGGSGEILFAVKNADGDTIFAVYDGGVRIYVDDTPNITKGSRGGFAVGGLNTNKGTITNEFFRVTPDSIRIYIDTIAAKGSHGGFAVGGLNTNKSTPNNEFLRITRDSVRVYVNDLPGKGSHGGFAVGGLNTNKGLGIYEYLRVTPDSVRIYVDDQTGKGSHGGFAVGGLNTNKGATDYMQMTKDNYFIGLGAGLNNTTGLFNSFLGYQSGLNNDIGTGNVFLGNQAGFNNKGGNHNVFIGSECGLNNTTGQRNVFLGEQTGKNNTTGIDNTFLGRMSGLNNTSGNYNVFIGERAGLNNTTGQHNIAVGTVSGANLIGGSRNVFIGDSSGCHNTYGVRNIYIGERSGATDSIGAYNVYIGYNAGRYAQSPQRIFNANYWNVVIGNEAGMNLSGNTSATFVGNQSGMNCTNADGCSFFGAGSGKNNTGSRNTFIGWRSGNQNSSGANNCFFGSEAGLNANGTGNVYLGQRAGEQMAAGNQNVCVGSGAGENGTTGSNNVYVGFTTAWTNSGSGNVFIGNGVAYSTSATSYSNKLWIDNTATTSPLIEGDFSTNAMKINGTFIAMGNTTFNSNVKLSTGGFSLETNPGTGTVPLQYVYQGGTKSTARGEAFAIHDAFWVTGRVYMSGLRNEALGTGLGLRYDASLKEVIYVSSSARYKTNIRDMEDINWLYKLRPVNFEYKKDKTKSKKYGLIAEEVEKVNKKFVAYNEEKQPEGVAYEDLIAPLLKAVQDQQKLIEELQKRIEALENK